MSNTGKDPEAATTPSFVAAIVTAAITVGVFTSVWLILHRSKKLREVFQPRVDRAPASKKPQALPDSPLSFWKTVFKLPDYEIIVANGPDAYFFVRYLKIFGLYMLAPYVLLTCVILIPVS
jgi:MFS superfamily sulfate permease-like transporter